jgi:hypothetical protein
MLLRRLLSLAAFVGLLMSSGCCHHRQMCCRPMLFPIARTMMMRSACCAPCASPCCAPCCDTCPVP